MFAGTLSHFPEQRFHTCRVFLCLLGLMLLTIPSTAKSDASGGWWSEELQLRWYRDEPIRDLPVLFVNQMSFGKRTDSDFIAFSPYASLLLSGMYYHVEQEGQAVRQGAVGGGLALGARIMGRNWWFLSFRPELSILGLAGPELRAFMLEFATDFGFHVELDDTTLNFYLLRIGIRPGSGDLMFYTLYPSFGITFSF